MTNEHEKLPSGKLAEALETAQPDVTYDQVTVLQEAARKYATLEPLLRELCEARGKIPDKIWSFVGHNWQDTSIYAEGERIAGLSMSDDVTEENQEEMEQAQEDTAHFICTAANITARIREVVDGKA